MKKITIAVSISLFCLYATASCAKVTGDWRYKLTLVVDDHGVEKSGSSVVECHGQSNYDEIHDVHNSQSTIGLSRGEATVVDLKEGSLFAILKNDDDSNYACDMLFTLFPIPGNSPHHMGGEGLPDGIRYYSSLKGKRDMPFDKLPMLVRFRNINDPKTVEKVDPNDLVRSFGTGVKLVKASIEMTKEPVTKGIEEKITWLNKWLKEGGNISGQVLFYQPPSPEKILIPANFLVSQ